MSDSRAELQSIWNRAALAEARRQAALSRGDRYAAADAEIELSRLWSRYMDIAQSDGLDAVRQPPR